MRTRSYTQQATLTVCAVVAVAPNPLHCAFKIRARARHTVGRKSSVRVVDV